MTLARSPVLLERVYVVVLGDVAVDVKSPAALAGPEASFSFPPRGVDRPVSVLRPTLVGVPGVMRRRAS